MNPFLYLLNPVVFFVLLFILLAIFILVMRSLSYKDKKSQDFLNKVISEKDTREKELKQSQEEIARLNSELSLKTQMFEGLKGQYNELEKDYEKLAQKSHESIKDVLQIGDPSQHIPQTIKPSSKNTDTGSKSQ